MAINDEIAAGGRPVQFENPLNNMVKFSNIQNDMANLQLHKQKAEADAAGMARKNELYNYLGSGGRDPNRIFQLGGHEELNQIRQGDTAEKLGKKTTAEIDKIHDETASQAFRNISQNPSNEVILAHNLVYQLNPNNSAERKAKSQQTTDMLINMPLDKRPAWLSSQGASAADLKPSQHVVASGDRTVVLTTPAYGGQSTEVGSVQMGATPKEKFDFGPKYLAEVAERDRTANDIKKTEALYNSSSGTPMREVYGSQLKDYYTRLEDQDKRIAGMKAEEAANKKAFEFKTLVADVAQLEANGQGNSPTAQRLKAKIAKETYIPPASMDLSPEQYNALYGPDGSVTQGRLDPYKVNGRTAKVYANAEITNPGTNFNQLAGTAALSRNAPFMGKQLTIEMLPKMLSNMSEAGKKLNFNDNKYFGAVQAWYKGASNDPDFISYMAQRNDVLLTLMGAMRSVGASDLAHRAEIDAAPQNMSPRAFDAYVAGQYKALEPRLAQAAKFTGSKPPAETSNAPAKTVTGQTVKNW